MTHTCWLFISSSEEPAASSSSLPAADVLLFSDARGGGGCSPGKWNVLSAGERLKFCQRRNRIPGGKVWSVTLGSATPPKHKIQKDPKLDSWLSTQKTCLQLYGIEPNFIWKQLEWQGTQRVMGIPLRSIRNYLIRFIEVRVELRATERRRNLKICIKFLKFRLSFPDKNEIFWPFRCGFARLPPSGAFCKGVCVQMEASGTFIGSRATPCSFMFPAAAADLFLCSSWTIWGDAAHLLLQGQFLLSVGHEGYSSTGPSISWYKRVGVEGGGHLSPLLQPWEVKFLLLRRGVGN